MYLLLEDMINICDIHSYSRRFFSFTQVCHVLYSAAKNLPIMQETWVRSLGQEDTLERGMATYSSVFV